MIDRESREISAIKAVFPTSAILLCWFHVLQVSIRSTSHSFSNVIIEEALHLNILIHISGNIQISKQVGIWYFRTTTYRDKKTRYSIHQIDETVHIGKVKTQLNKTIQ